MAETDLQVAADIAFRRRCLTVNTGIYTRRFGSAALALLPEGSAVRRRFAAELDWMGSEFCLVVAGRTTDRDALRRAPAPRASCA